jgi:hypothetical protein
MTTVNGNIVGPDTSSTAGIYQTLREALRTYVSPSGATLATLMQSAYGQNPTVRTPPTPLVFPYITMLLNRTSSQASNGYRETAVLEVQCSGRPEAQAQLVEDIMDLVDQCLTSYTEPRSGLIWCRSRNRYSVPQYGTPADAQVVSVVGMYDIVLWPAVLTSRRPDPQ